MSLRDYVESKADITLLKLNKILFFHYKEKGVGELCDNLRELTQLREGTTQEFLVYVSNIHKRAFTLHPKRVILHGDNILTDARHFSAILYIHRVFFFQ